MAVQIDRRYGQEPTKGNSVNFFSLMTMVGGLGAVYAYCRGVSCTMQFGETGATRAVHSKWHRVFDFCVSLTILSALTSI